MNRQPPTAAKVACTALIVAADVIGLILLWSTPRLGAGILVAAFIVTMVIRSFGLLYLLGPGKTRWDRPQE